LNNTGKESAVGKYMGVLSFMEDRVFGIVGCSAGSAQILCQ
jgi:hypothetical protein